MKFEPSSEVKEEVSNKILHFIMPKKNEAKFFLRILISIS